MPLPFAPPPSQSKVYADLKNITLEDLTPDEFDTLKSSVFAQGVDGAEDEYRRLLLLGSVSNNISISGPMPGTMKVVETTIGSDENTRVSLFTPPEGQIWQMLDAVYERTGSGTVNYYTGYWDGSTGSTGAGFVSILDTSSSEGHVQLDDWPGSPVYVSSDVTIALYFNTGTVTAMKSRVALVRVR